MWDKNTEITIEKARRLIDTYSNYEFEKIEELTTGIYIPDKEYFSVPQDVQYSVANQGMTWGDNGNGYAWFSSSYTIPNTLNGKCVRLLAVTGASEALLFIDGKPCGMYDHIPDILKPEERLHKTQVICTEAKAGQKIQIDIEAYGGHNISSCMPLSDKIANDMYPAVRERKFDGLFIVLRNELIYDFRIKLKTVVQLFDSMSRENSIKWQSFNVLCNIVRIVKQIPTEYDLNEVYDSVKEAKDVLDEFLNLFQDESQQSNSNFGKRGLIGHSHLDTAWRWTVGETVHKAARTFSNALSLIKRKDDYVFLQSSVVYIDWMKKHYPDIYNGIVEQTKNGNWEPNGASWVECDGNMTGGEYLIRQFLRGQRYLMENLDYRADCFWQPDTFGYSPAIPQIMLGCGLKYFLTTKLSWNECNEFPYDTFVWRGIDGSNVISHFNIIGCWPDAKTLLSAPVLHPECCDAKLISYGFGDGGGGPSEEMVDTALLTSELNCLPESRHITVSEFMKYIDKNYTDLPIYDGELYLEMHRGTFTQMHDIKRSNRKAEIALHDLETINVHRNSYDKKEKSKALPELLDTLLINQFHDILPGTAIAEVHDRAIKENYSLIEQANEIAKDLLIQNDEGGIVAYNTLSFERNDVIEIDGSFQIDGYQGQDYTTIDGKKKTVISGVKIPPMCALNFKPGKSLKGTNPFVFNNKELETPFYKVKFNDNGEISSLFDKKAERYIQNNDGYALNTFLFGEDVPMYWDSWNTDYDHKFKLKNNAKLVSEEVVSTGAVEHRIRRIYLVGSSTEIKQDMVFYANDLRIDFDTVIDWKEKHSILKVTFPLDIRTTFVRNETQFGFITRANNENTSIERSKFEVCNHKWSDVSENRYGVALLNDCKYGISVLDSEMRLTLHRGGCSPDNRGDFGLHKFAYSLLPHNSGFSADSVIKPAYMFNYKPIVSVGTSSLQSSLFEIDKPNVIAETVKFSEDNDGYVIRLYESECNKTNFSIKPNFDFSKVEITNMLEEYVSTVDIQEKTLNLTIKPFEIITLKFKI